MALAKSVKTICDCFKTYVLGPLSNLLDPILLQ